MGSQCHIWGLSITLWGPNVIYRVPGSPMRTPYHLMGSHCHPMGSQCHIRGPNITLWGLKLIYRVPLSPMGIFMPPYRAPLPPYGVPVTPMGPRCPQAPSNTDTKGGGSHSILGVTPFFGALPLFKAVTPFFGVPSLHGGDPSPFWGPPMDLGSSPPPLSAAVLWSHRAAPAPGSAPGPGSWGGAQKWSVGTPP